MSIIITFLLATLVVEHLVSIFQRKEASKLMATGNDALAALQKFVTDLTKAAQDTATALKDVLAKISAAAGADPTAVVNLVEQGEKLVAGLEQAASDAEAAINPQAGGTTGTADPGTGTAGTGQNEALGG